MNIRAVRALSLRPVAAGAAALALCAGMAHAQAVPEIVLANSGHAPESPKADVPGFPGIQYTNFTVPNRTPTTDRYIVVATTTATPATQDQFAILGDGLNATVFAREGVTEYAPGQTISFGVDVPRMNDAGQWALAFAPTGLASSQRHVVRFTGDTAELIAAPLGPVPALDGFLYNSSPAFSLGGITSSGQAGFVANIVDGDFILLEQNRAILLADGQTAAGVRDLTGPSGQLTGGNQNYNNITASRFYMSAAGGYIVSSTLFGDSATDLVVVVNGAVVIQEGFPIPGSTLTSPVSSIADTYMEPNGSWMARGSNADGTNWFVRNGQVVAATGQPIVPGSSETWTTFLDLKQNNAGDYVVVGNTNNASTLLNSVVVLNGETLLVRKSDGVDLSGNGQADDGLFIERFTDRNVLLDDGYFYFGSRLKVSPTATSSLTNNVSFIRVAIGDTTPACPADFNDDGTVNTADITAFLSAWFAARAGGPAGGADFNTDGVVNTADITAFLSAWFDARAGGC